MLNPILKIPIAEIQQVPWGKINIIREEQGFLGICLGLDLARVNELDAEQERFLFRLESGSELILGFHLSDDKTEEVDPEDLFHKVGHLFFHPQYLILEKKPVLFLEGPEKKWNKLVPAWMDLIRKQGFKGFRLVYDSVASPVQILQLNANGRDDTSHLNSLKEGQRTDQLKNIMINNPEDSFFTVIGEMEVEKSLQDLEDLRIGLKKGSGKELKLLETLHQLKIENLDLKSHLTWTTEQLENHKTYLDIIRHEFNKDLEWYVNEVAKFNKYIPTWVIKLGKFGRGIYKRLFRKDAEA